MSASQPLRGARFRRDRRDLEDPERRGRGARSRRGSRGRRIASRGRGLSPRPERAGGRGRPSSRSRPSLRSTWSWRRKGRSEQGRVPRLASRLGGPGSHGTQDQPLRVAIVGSGPSGFYAAGHLLKCKSHPDLVAQVDVFDRLPTPWGLVRGGRGARPPEHQGRQPGLREDRGPPRVSLLRQRRVRHRPHPRRPARALPRGDLRGRRADRPADGDPGRGPARAAGRPPSSWPGTTATPTIATSSSTSRASARSWSATATWPPTWRACWRSPARSWPPPTWPTTRSTCWPNRTSGRSSCSGRRGPAQAAFTNPELLELGEMTDADVFVDPRDVEVDPLSRALAGERGGQHHDAQERRHPDRLRRPRARRASAGGSCCASSSRRSRSSARARRGHPHLPQRAARRGRRACAHARPTRSRSSTAGIVFRSIGYRGIPLPGLPFDERGRHDPQRGRADHRRRTATPVAGEYVVGWIKRGPTGIIGTNKRDAQETVDALLADLDAGRLNQPARPRPRLAGGAARRAQARARDLHAAGRRSTRAEQAAGEPHGRPRVKLTGPTSCWTRRGTASASPVGFFARVVERQQSGVGRTKSAHPGRRDGAGRVLRHTGRKSSHPRW